MTLHAGPVAEETSSVEIPSVFDSELVSESSWIIFTEFHLISLYLAVVASTALAAEWFPGSVLVRFCFARFICICIAESTVYAYTDRPYLVIPICYPEGLYKADKS